MEKVSIEFSEDELEQINQFKKEKESLESALKRMILTHISEIPKSLWTANIDPIFNEFDETFQILAE